MAIKPTPNILKDAMIRYFLFILFMTIFLRSSDQPKIEFIKAKFAFPSLQKLATQKIVEQFQKPSDDKNRKTLQSYVDASRQLPYELHALLKKNLAQHFPVSFNNPVLTIRFQKNTDSIFLTCMYKINKQGTLMIYNDPTCKNRLLLRDFTSQDTVPTPIEHESFSHQDGPFSHTVRAYFMNDKNDSLILLGSKPNPNYPLFEYIPRDKSLNELYQIPSYVNTIKFVFADKKKLLILNRSCQQEIITEKGERFELPGSFVGVDDIDNEYLLIMSANQFHCYNATDGKIHLRGPGTHAVMKSSYIYAKSLTDDWQNIDIWSLKDKQLLRKILLSANLQNRPPLKPELTFPDMFLVSRSKLLLTCYDGDLMNLYTLNLNTGIYDCVSRKLKKPYWTNTKQPANTSKPFFFMFKSNTLWVDGKIMPIDLSTRYLESIIVSDNMHKVITRNENEVSIYTTSLHTLYNTELPELLSMLFKHDNKDSIQDS